MAGFELVGNANAGDYTGKVRTYYISSAGQNYAIGDVVVLSASGSHTDGTPLVVAGAQGAAVTGVIVDIAPDFSDENFSSIGLASGASGYVKVMDDPDALYEVESDTTLTATQVGLNAEANFTAPTVSGNLYISNNNLDGGATTTPATTSTLQFRILKLLEGKTSGTLGDRALVKINNSTSNTGTAGV